VRVATALNEAFHINLSHSMRVISEESCACLDAGVEKPLLQALRSWRAPTVSLTEDQRAGE
jgi:hypothetical protein